MSSPAYMDGLEYVRPLHWADVFAFWRENEGSNPDWIKLAHERGFASWEEWRHTYIAPFRLGERSWNLYRIVDPLTIVPAFHGGPFRGWIEQFYGDAGSAPTFETIATRLESRKNGRVLSLLASFPQQTTITALLTEDGIVTIEGMHRCAAIAVAAREGKKIQTELLLALGSELPGVLPIVGGHRKGESPTGG